MGGETGSDGGKGVRGTLKREKRRNGKLGERLKAQWG